MNDFVRRRSLQGLFFSLLLASFTVAPYALAKSNYLLPTTLINIYLQLHSPIVKEYPPFFKIQLNTIDLTTQQLKQRITIQSAITLFLQQQTVIKGKIGFSASLAYNPNTQQVYIQQPSIELLEIENLNTSTDAFLTRMNPILSRVLDGLIIYEFTKENAMVPKAPSQLSVEDRGIRFFFD